MQLVKVRGKTRSSTRLDEERTNPVLCRSWAGYRETSFWAVHSFSDMIWKSALCCPQADLSTWSSFFCSEKSPTWGLLAGFSSWILCFSHPCGSWQLWIPWPVSFLDTQRSSSLVLGTGSVSHQAWCQAVSASVLLWASFLQAAVSPGEALASSLSLITYPA